MAKGGGKHRGNTGNLRPPWQPGESGNPKGRPKGTSITDRLRKIVERDDGKVADALAQAAAKAALKGDFRFWNAILDRLEGPVPQRLHHGEDEERPMRLRFVTVDKPGDDG